MERAGGLRESERVLVKARPGTVPWAGARMSLAQWKECGIVTNRVLKACSSGFLYPCRDLFGCCATWDKYCNLSEITERWQALARSNRFGSPVIGFLWGASFKIS